MGRRMQLLRSWVLQILLEQFDVCGYTVAGYNAGIRDAKERSSRSIYKRKAAGSAYCALFERVSTLIDCVEGFSVALSI